MDYIVFNNDGDMVAQFTKDKTMQLELYFKLGYNILDLETGKLVVKDIWNINYCG